jgi:hypothetical protein
MQKRLLTLVAASCLVSVAGPALAWEKFTIGLDPAGAKTVKIDSDGVIADISAGSTIVSDVNSQLAGQFKVNVDAANPGSLLDGSSFYTFCVELTQTLASPTTLAMNYQVQASTAQVTSAKLATLSQLLTAGKASDATLLTSALSNDRSTAFQAAVWEVVYETAGSFSLSGGNIMFGQGSVSAAALTWANGLFTGLSSVAPLYSLQVLSSQTHQDYLVATPVPEPEAYGLALAGMGVVAFAMRRRRGAGKHD